MTNKLHFYSLFCMLLLALQGYAQKGTSAVPQPVMEKIYNEVKTPYKYGLVLVPAHDWLKIDCPTVFRKGKDWYMTYIQFDGRGYQTWLAKSNDLLNWQPTGKVLPFSADTTEWDAHQRAGYPSLVDTKWGEATSTKSTKENIG